MEIIGDTAVLLLRVPVYGLLPPPPVHCSPPNQHYVNWVFWLHLDIMNTATEQHFDKTCV